MYNEKLKTADTRTSSDLAPNVSTVENSLGCCALLAGAGSSGHCLEWPARPRARLQRLQQRHAHLGRLRIRLRVKDRDRDRDRDIGLW